MKSRIHRVELENGQEIEIEIQEVEGRIEGTAEAGLADDISRKLADSLDKLRVVSATVVKTLRESNPEEIEVSFGAKLGGSTNLILSAGSAEANLNVKLKWKRTPASEK